MRQVHRSLSLPFTTIKVFNLQDSFRIRQVLTSDLDHSLQSKFICGQFAPAGEMRSKSCAPPREECNKYDLCYSAFLIGQS
jgi:hypothetical protein